MIRKGTYSIEFIESLMKENVLQYIDIKKKPEGKKVKPLETIIDGETIYTLSDRYKLFFTQGYTCTCCGLTASFFALEKSNGMGRYHLNLYGVNDKGKEILFTKDHIIPKSKGGANDLSNYQTMCVRCNNKKGDGEGNHGNIYADDLITNPIQQKLMDSATNIARKTRCFIMYEGLFLNIKLTQKTFFTVDHPRQAKGYTKREAAHYITVLLENGVLSDRNIDNYQIIPKKNVRLPEKECC